MKTTKTFAYLSIVIYIAVVLFTHEPLKAIGPAVTIAVVVCSLYNRVFWRLNPLEKVPKLRRKYSATSISTHNGKYEYDSVFKIKQTLTNIHVVEYFNNRACESITATLTQSDSGEWSLIYTYYVHANIDHNTENLDDAHYGTAILRIIDRNHLKGHYFTDRYIQTKGTTELWYKLKGKSTTQPIESNVSTSTHSGSFSHSSTEPQVNVPNLDDKLNDAKKRATNGSAGKSDNPVQVKELTR